MLFILDSSITAIDPNNILQSRALETLLSAYQMRNHLLFIEMADLTSLREFILDSIGLSSRVALNTLHNKLPEYGQLNELIDFKVIVYIQNEKRTGIYRVGNTWNIPLEYFGSFGLISTAVLGEDQIDAELYIALAQHYAEKAKIRGFIIAARPKGGGGSNTPKELASYLRHEYSPCICITDSDKFHPNFKTSLTNKNCNNVAGVPNRVVEHLPLEEREVENLIPIDLLKKSGKIEDFLRCADEKIIDNDEFWKYLDIKNGVTLGWLERQDLDTQVYWKKAISALSRTKKQCKTCKDEPTSTTEGKICTCQKIDGLGSKVLVNVLGYLDSNNIKINLRLMADDIRWETVAKRVFDFSVAPGGEMALT